MLIPKDLRSKVVMLIVEDNQVIPIKRGTLEHRELGNTYTFAVQDEDGRDTGLNMIFPEWDIKNAGYRDNDASDSH